jgi:hypothetical protein
MPGDVAAAFKEVARRAGEQDVVTGRRKRPNPAAAPPPPRDKTDDEIAYETRPGRPKTGQRFGDVNLPYEGPALSALKRR